MSDVRIVRPDAPRATLIPDDPPGNRQPAMDELRAQLPWRGKYAAQPGTGPDGKTCHDCAFLRYTGGGHRYPKCGRTKYTHGDATTIKTRSPACRLFAAADVPPETPQ